MEAKTRTVFGVMTGTSLDGLDVAAIEWDLASTPKLLGVESTDLGEAEPILRRLASGQPCNAAEIARAGLAFAHRHVSCIAQLADRVGPADLIAVHGQTVFHEPPASWQLMNPWPIAREFGVPVVSDLRGLDLATGGEGAPITPLSDSVWFGSDDETRVVLNLGGFANATLLPARAGADQVRGFDICACNHLLDRAARRAIGQPFDRDGQAAQRGTAQRDIVEKLTEMLRAQASAGRSLGSLEDIAVAADLQHQSGENLLASVVEAVAGVIGEAISAHAPDRMIAAGGGAYNQALVRALRRACSADVVLSDTLGMPVEAREAAAIATLGALAASGQPITLPGVTGRTGHSGVIDGLWCLPRTMADASRVWRTP